MPLPLGMSGQRLALLISTGSILPHLAFSLSSWIVGLLLASLIGLSLGLILGLHRASGLIFEPLFVAVSTLPKVTLYPMVLLICGLGQSSKKLYLVLFMAYCPSCCLL